MKTLITTLLLAVAIFAHAQKLPAIQQKSVLAPKNLKIDGKTNEWEGFQAYNNATGLHYTIANDDKNLYLSIRATDPDVLSKITQKGIVFAVDPSGKRNEMNTVSVQYPVFEIQYKNKPYIKFSNAGGLTADQRREILTHPDSMLAVANKRLKANDKYIRTSGMAGVDTLLSVYNDKDIVARQSFDKWELYNYELSIPLKYLNLAGGESKKFSYHIILKGFDVATEGGLTKKIVNGVVAYTMDTGASLYKRENYPAIRATTDFWGEYTLAK